MKPTSRRLLTILFALAVLAALALPKLLPSQGDQPAPAAPAPAPKLRVQVHEVAPERLTERLSTTGTVRADEQIELVSEIEGTVREVHFREGARVAAGELLVEIDDTELQAELDRAVYRVELAERREQRQRELVDEGVISQQDYDLVLNQLNILRAEQRLIEAQIVKTDIRAPFAGVLGLRQVSKGAYLSTQTPIATLQDLDHVKVDFSVPEKYASQMGLGGQISFRVKGVDRMFQGTIYAIEPNVDVATRSLQLRARCANPDRVLVPGAFADVEILVRELPAALTVPSIAVIPELGGKKVFVVEDGTVRPRAVETGMRTEDRLEVTRGLAAGERVAVSAIQQLRPGLEVEVVAAP